MATLPGDIANYMQNNNTNVEVYDENGIRQRAQLVAFARGTSAQPLDIAIQDQFTPIVDRFLTRKLGTATLASPTVFDGRTVTLEAGHGFVIGNMIEIEEDGNSYQSRVINVATNTITMTNPFCRVYTTAATVRRVSPDLTVSATPASPIKFTQKPPEGVLWDINLISFNMLDDTIMDDGKFGGIPALTNGVVYRTVNGDCDNIFTSLDNSCFRRHCDYFEYSDRAPAGLYGLHCIRHFNSQQGDGVSRRIGSTEVSEFEAIVADDLTGLTRFWVVLRGHVVE